VWVHDQFEALAAISTNQPIDLIRHRVPARTFEYDGAEREIAEEGERMSGRYGARPPLSAERLSEAPDGRLVVRFKRPMPDGSTEVRLTPKERIRRLSALRAAPGYPTDSTLMGRAAHEFSHIASTPSGDETLARAVGRYFSEFQGDSVWGAYPVEWVAPGN
jgi:hypothetical protein